ncbi:MAG: hypothetical protein KBT36_06895 [Kurthia sp.]|nr:hypothetical protein [Candidatus Kurthia equi]
MYKTSELMKLSDTELNDLLRQELHMEGEMEALCRATMIERLVALNAAKQTEYSAFTWKVSFDEINWIDIEPDYAYSKEAVYQYLLNGGGFILFEQWCVENNYTFDENEQITFYLGCVDPFTPEISVNAALEEINAMAWRHSGELADGYLMTVDEAAKEELQKQLNGVLNNWLTKQDLHPAFNAMTNIQSFSLPHWTLMQTI